jgi:hypothetical protein
MRTAYIVPWLTAGAAVLVAAAVGLLVVLAS